VRGEGNTVSCTDFLQRFLYRISGYSTDGSTLPQAKSEVEEDFFTIVVPQWKPHIYWAKRSFSQPPFTKELQIKK
jgi:hypothetical protein